jgi:hypothetical protein
MNNFTELVKKQEEEITIKFLNELREKAEYHKWFFENQNEYIIDNADICELAHHYTIVECIRAGMTLDQIDTKDENGNQIYTKEAQAIFDKHHDIITNTLSV